MKKVYFNSEKCLGCLSCEFLCAVEHSKSKNPHKAHLEPEGPVPRRKVRLVDGAYRTLACRHCGKAACVKACTAGAMVKDENTGEVSCITDKCDACWLCVKACPFGAVRAGSVYPIKCDMCPDRESPACVEGCPTGALYEATPEEFRKLTEARKAAKKATKQAEVKR